VPDGNGQFISHVVVFIPYRFPFRYSLIRYTLSVQTIMIKIKEHYRALNKKMDGYVVSLNSRFMIGDK
jgi:hypothetical protein